MYLKWKCYTTSNTEIFPLELSEMNISKDSDTMKEVTDLSVQGQSQREVEAIAQVRIINQLQE